MILILMVIDLGKKVRASYVPPEVFAKLGFTGARELSIMFDWFDQYGVYGEKINGRGKKRMWISFP